MRKKGSTLPEATDSWQRAWKTGSYGGVDVAVERLGSVADARRVAADWLDPEISDAVGTFRVPGADGAVGLRFLGLSWLWVQAPTVGPFIDDVQQQYGTLIVDIRASGLSTSADHSEALEAARQVRQLASH